jgi:FlaA1/EpsC-like NDP-sugar epimerase
MYVSVDEVLRVVTAVFTGNFAWWLIVMLAHFPGYIRSVPVIAAMLQVFGMLGLRLVYRKMRTDAQINKRKHRGVILGAGSAGANALREITYSDKYDTKIIGFIDNDKRKIHKTLNGVTVLGTDDDLEEIVEKPTGKYLTGYTGNYIRTYIDISDGNAAGIDTSDPESLLDRFVEVKLTGIIYDGMTATVV